MRVLRGRLFFVTENIEVAEVVDATEKVVCLPNGQLPSEDADGDIIDLLEDMMTRARRGDLVAVAVAGVYSDGADDFVTDFHKGGDVQPSRLIGAVELLKFRILEKVAS